jgi:protein-disulfide isomerase
LVRLSASSDKPAAAVARGVLRDNHKRKRMNTKTIGLAGLTAMLLATASPGMGEPPPLTSDQETRVTEIVRAYLLAHPEVIAEAMQAYRERQSAEEAAKIAQGVQQHRDELLADPTSPVGGNAEGPVTVVEFFDYNCPYCRHAEPVLAELLTKNPDVRLVYKEFPTLADSSRFAARAALAAGRQSPELYRAFHNALMKAEGRVTEDKVIEIAAAAGVNIERMRADMEDPAIAQSIDKNIELARAIGASGTPAFVIEDTVLVGFKPLQQMESAIADARPPSARRP